MFHGNMNVTLLVLGCVSAFGIYLTIDFYELLLLWRTIFAWFSGFIVLVILLCTIAAYWPTCSTPVFSESNEQLILRKVTVDPLEWPREQDTEFDENVKWWIADVLAPEDEDLAQAFSSSNILRTHQPRSRWAGSPLNLDTADTDSPSSDSTTELKLISRELEDKQALEGDPAVIPDATSAPFNPEAYQKRLNDFTATFGQWRSQEAPYRWIETASSKRPAVSEEEALAYQADVPSLSLLLLRAS